MEKMELKSRAEMQLLSALNQKKGRSASMYLKEEQLKQQVEKEQELEQIDDESFKISRSQDLKQFRQTQMNPQVKEEEEMIAEVRQLKHYVEKSTKLTDPTRTQENSNQIQLNATMRRDRHMEAQKNYLNQVKEISDDIEDTLISAADRVKESLASIDDRLRHVEEELENETLLLSSENEVVLEKWTKMEQICQARTQEIAFFAKTLEEIEQNRAKKVGAELKKLTEILIDTAYALPPEVERIIEAEAYDLNIVLIANRKCYADLISRMAKADVEVFVAKRLFWEKGQVRWRHLRHHQAIQNFQTILKSTNFTNPIQRQEIMIQMQMFQREIHETKRMEQLQFLLHSNAKLTSEQMICILQRLNEIQKEEEKKNQVFFQKLTQVHEEKIQEAKKLREALRFELHGFGALTKQAELVESKIKLINLMGNENLEEFFRMAGGLKMELDFIVKSLNLAELIYPSNVEPLLNCLQLLLSALPLEKVMEAQGKSTERKAIQLTLEKIRKATKHEIPGLLPVLQVQMTVLLHLNDMESIFKDEVKEISNQIENILKDFSNGTTNVSNENPVLTGNLLSNGTSNHPIQNTTMQTGATGIPSVLGKHHSTNMIDSSVTSPTSTGVSGSPTLTFNLDLQAVRKAQRRLGTLVYATELSTEFQTHLKFMMEQLQIQTIANNVVDQVITTESDQLVVTQEKKSNFYLQSLYKKIEAQCTLLHEQSEKFVKFFVLIVKKLENQTKQVEMSKFLCINLLNSLEEMHEENNTKLEKQFETGSRQVRHAANEQELKDQFVVACQTLGTIEEEYRIYQKKIEHGSKMHPIVVEKQRRAFLKVLCEFFGLTTVQKTNRKSTDSILTIQSLPESIRSLKISPEELQLENEALLSISHIDRCVKLVQEATRGPSSTPSHQESPAIAANNGAPQTNESSGTTNELPTKTSTLKALEEITLPILEPFKTSDGMELGVAAPLNELIESILNYKEPQEESQANEIDIALSAELLEASSLGSDESNLEPSAAETSDSNPEFTRKEEELHEDVLMLVDGDFVRLEISSSFMRELVSSFRLSVLSKYDFESRNVADAAKSECERRIEACNFLLEERLRTHWPRKGRLDVQCYQPRVGELSSHRQRQERHVRGVYKKLDTQEQGFEKSIAELLQIIEVARVKQLTLEAQLPMQQSLAALQGLEAKCKKHLQSFKIESEEKILKLKNTTTSDLSQLITTCHEFLRVCSRQLFGDLMSLEVISGCDYHPDEIDSVKKAMQEVEAHVRSKIGTREDQMNAITMKQMQVLELVKSFKTRFQASLQSLSMKEGLGQRYGLPRRTAQEKFRSETTRSDENAARIDELLANLHSLVQTRKCTLKGSKVPPTVSTQIIYLLLQLRAKLYTRGMYFGLIKNVIQLELVPIVLELHEMIEGRIDSSSFVRLNDKEIADPEDIDTKSFMTFIDRVKQIDLKCREDTKLLYQQEGKMDELPASGIPIALEEYLTEQNEKAKAYILSQELKYQEQVDFFGELLAEAVPTAIEDFILRSQKYLEQIHDTRSIEIEKEYKKWIDLKEKHLLALRPDLCSPNNAECLKELCFKEALRTQTAQTNLKQFRAELLCEDIKNSILFEKQLVSVFRCLMLILDSSLMTLEDLKSFSGQEMPKSKRKSLKRLRKIARIQENGDAREVKRSEDELKKLKQSGESPRFPKRSWPAIESFGIHTFWVQEKQRLLAQDPSDALLADMVPLVAPNTDSGACVSLLTHAHRCALHARDEGYSTYVAFLKTLCTNMTQKIHERLKDEKKWTQSWMITIDKMQKPPSSIS